MDSIGEIVNLYGLYQKNKEKAPVNFSVESMFKTRKLIKNDNGFSLVELMVTVFLTVIAVIAIYRGYTAFSQATDAQQQVIEMQQNLRIGMTRMIVDIRRAGMNEEGDDIAGFIAAGATSVEFSMDIGSANGPVVLPPTARIMMVTV